MLAVYARQSVDKKDSISIETQIDACLKMAADNTSQYRIYEDKGYSGSNTNRPKFEKMMDDISAGMISQVVVYKLDRISRSLLDFVQIYEAFRKHGVEFISCNERFDTGTPIGTAMLSIVMVFAQLERETIQMRIKDNYYSRGEKGLYLGGRAPFGYQKIPVNYQGKKTYMFQEDIEQASVVKDVFKMYADNTTSYGRIAKWLNNQNILTNNEKPWSSVSLGRMIRNPVYVKANADIYLYLKKRGAMLNNEVGQYIGENGCYLYAERKNVTSSKFADLSRSYVTLGLHKGIIEPDIWLSCQYVADRNKALKNSGRGTHSWLSGLMKCGYCSYSVTVVNGYKDVLYINCGGRRRHICQARRKAIHLDDIETAVQKKLLEKLSELRVSDPISQEYDAKLNQLKISLAQIDDNINTLVSSLVDMNEVSSKYINDEINKYDKAKEDVVLKINDIVSKKTKKKNDKRTLDSYLKNWDGCDIESKKAVAKSVINQVTITDEEIAVSFKF